MPPAAPDRKRCTETNLGLGSLFPVPLLIEAFGVFTRKNGPRAIRTEPSLPLSTSAPHSVPWAPCKLSPLHIPKAPADTASISAQTRTSAGSAHRQKHPRLGSLPVHPTHPRLRGQLRARLQGQVTAETKGSSALSVLRASHLLADTQILSVLRELARRYLRRQDHVSCCHRHSSHAIAANGGISQISSP